MRFPLYLSAFLVLGACAPAKDDQAEANTQSESPSSQSKGPQLSDPGTTEASEVSTTNASAMELESGEEHWSAYSKTAVSITGDIVLSPTRLRSAGAEFPLSFVKNVNDFEGLSGKVSAQVFEVTQTIDPELLNGNKLGGGSENPTRWIVFYQFDEGKSLAMETFEGEELPSSTNDSGHSGSYYYTRE